MGSLSKEVEFFHKISLKIRSLIDKKEAISIAEDKGAGDYSTSMDLAVEKLTVDEIQKTFPKDSILSEESHKDTALTRGRVWIIDPICGTTNLAKGINNFCTNIALANNGKLIAACVVDHSQKTYIWSTGENKIYINDKLHKRTDNHGVVIDIDIGAVRDASTSRRQKHSNLVSNLISKTGFGLLSLNTSLGFAYTSIGKTDGFISINNYPWDICAAAFLVRQAGGVITGLDGSAWTVETVGAIGARNTEIHQKLLRAYRA